MPTPEQILAAGIIQALNLDFLHPVGLCARVVSDDRIEIHSFPNARGPILFANDQVRTDEFRATRLAYLQWQRRQVIARAAYLVRSDALVSEGIYQVVPGRYCLHCGCTQLAACITPSGPCGWILEPNSNGMPGICSACADSLESLEI